MLVASCGLLVGAAATGEAAIAMIAFMVLVAGAAAYRPAYGLAALALIAPLDVIVQVGPFQLLVVVPLLAALVGAWSIRRLRRDLPLWRATSLDVPVLLFAAATALSLIGSSGHRDEQLSSLLVALAGFLVFAISTQTLLDWSDVWLVIGSVLVAQLLQAVATALPVLAGAHSVSEQTRAAGTLVDPNHFAGALVLVIPLVLALGAASRSRVVMLPTALATIALTIAIVATLSRSGWFGLLAAGTVLVLGLPQYRRRFAMLAGAAIVIVLAAGLIPAIGARLAPHPTGPWEMLASRWRVWTAAIDMTIHHPLLGVGVGNFRNEFPLYGPRPVALNHAHDLFLNIAAERGVLGLLAFGLVLAALFGSLRRALRRVHGAPNRALAVGLIAAFAGYLVHSVFEVSYYDPAVLLLFWLLAGLAARMPGLPVADANRQRQAVAGLRLAEVRAR